MAQDPGCLLKGPSSLLPVHLKHVGKPGTTVSQHRDFPQTQSQNAMGQCTVEWKDGRHGVTRGAQRKYSTHSVRRNLQKSLMGPSFVEAGRTKKIQNTLDTVRVKQLSSWHSSQRTSGFLGHISRGSPESKFFSLQACLEDSFILF